MNTKLNISHKAIKQLLNASLSRLGQPALTQLRDARMQALVRYESCRELRQAMPSHSLAGGTLWPTIGMQHKPQLWAVTVLIIAMLLGVAAYWQQQVAENDLAEVDISILTDDLPMHVYLD